jgi:hypothetical protein
MREVEVEEENILEDEARPDLEGQRLVEEKNVRVSLVATCRGEE